jgi:hypothetical protein
MDRDGRTRYMRYGSRWLASWVALVLACIAVAAAAGTSSAASKSSIEGVWSFNGGEIAVQPEGNGDFEGVVVQPTLFASCTHPAGQKIWKEIAPQADGSYWGFHQWYKTAECVENPVLGPTAWRVLSEANGAQYLRICLSSPGADQPTIPQGSAGSGASYGCQSSSLTAPLASSRVGGFKDVASLPSARKCLSVRRFAIHIRDAHYDPFRTVTVTLRGHKVRVVLHGHVYSATINLKGLPRGAFTVRVQATTFRGNRVVGSRRYHTCAKKPLRKPKHKHTTARGK